MNLKELDRILTESTDTLNTKSPIFGKNQNCSRVGLLWSLFLFFFFFFFLCLFSDVKFASAMQVKDVTSPFEQPGQRLPYLGTAPLP